MRISDWSSDVCSSDLHEAVIDLLMHQSAAGAGADLALVEREHGETFQRLVEIIVILSHHIGKEDVGRLASQLDRTSVVSGKSVSVRVDLGGRRIIKKKNNIKYVKNTRLKNYKK